jgi:dienelactone hydrolase
MRIVRGRRLVVLLAVVVAVIAAAVASSPFLHGLSFVIRAADLHGVARRAADLGAQRASERDLTIATTRGPLHGRLYEPSNDVHRTALLTSGLHPAGINEPRLVALARQLSASGVAVLTPDIPQLSNFEITPAITDQIESAAVWLAGNGSPDRRVALIGISFSGGLSVVAAGRPSLRDRVAYVLSFGGHDDLPRVLRYLCTGLEPAPPDARGQRDARDSSKSTATADGRGRPDEPLAYRAPHDYGVAVILLGVADRMVPADQVAPLEAAVRRFLWASHLDRVDKPQADREFAALRTLARAMPEPSATLFGYVNDRDVAHLGSRLLPAIAFYGREAALSPSKSPKPAAPVFLLHGIDDNVIPAAESEYLADDLRGHAPTRLLLSGLISHAEVDQPVHAEDVMKLASFWGDLLSR